MRTAKIIFIILVAVFILGSAGAAVYFYNRSAASKNGVGTAENTEDIVARVSRLIVLPENEAPTIATVTDPTLLTDQPFFANTKQGDKVLIYAKAKKAILYDPVADKIVEVAPLNIGTNSGP